MKIQLYLFLIFVVTIIALGTWLMILFNINPYTSDIMSIAAFLATLYLWLTGIIALILFYLRINLTNKEVIFAHLPISIRQANLISLALILVLILSIFKVLTWWSGALAVVSVLLLEMFFRTKESY